MSEENPQFIHWHKGFFTDSYTLKIGGETVGQIKEGFWCRKSKGIFQNTTIEFQRKGFFTSTTDLIDKRQQSVIGQIRFNTWRNKATIDINDRTFQWSFDNFWGTRWSIIKNGVSILKYKSKFNKGEIEASVINEELILSGLFIHNYFIQILGFMAVFVIIISASG